MIFATGLIYGIFVVVMVMFLYIGSICGVGYLSYICLKWSKESYSLFLEGKDPLKREDYCKDSESCFAFAIIFSLFCLIAVIPIAIVCIVRYIVETQKRKKAVSPVGSEVQGHSVG